MKHLIIGSLLVVILAVLAACSASVGQEISADAPASDASAAQEVSATGTAGALEPVGQIVDVTPMSEAELAAQGPGQTAGGAATDDDEPPSVASWRALQRVVRLEIVGLLVVLVLTGQLANTTPARTSVAPGVQSVSAPLGSGTLEVTVDPARPGRNDVHAYLLDSKGRPDDRFESASIELAVPAEDVGPLVREPVRAGPGHFVLVGTDLELAGDWTLTLIVRPDRFTEQRATVGFRVG